ncbi:histidine phosphatase superfamily branch 1 [Hokovirus HKV1]|uniref:Histidine phosphatase superfamily branch 1 n=1 Tax=Hokovirus HKV1 TaxID=1977638 RepID=A0A1V0SGD9_9VIRU|nr:histidine phosphatase superfamily branch 1 [Hokovirus HKV1]
MDNIEITIDWIRHGYSCANAYKSIYTYTSLMSSLINDPVLTRTGIEQAKKLNNYVSNNKTKFDYDIICCSNLRRAIETAAFAFNDKDTKKTLYILPFISEVKNPGSYVGLDKENFAIDEQESIKYIDEIINKNKLNIKQDRSIYNETFNMVNDKSKLMYPNYDYFIENILPMIIKKCSPNKKSYKIGIVSHSHFISTIIQDITKNYKNVVRVDNTSVWREVLIVKPIIKYKVEERLNKCDNIICNEYKGVLEGAEPDNLLRCKRTSRLFGKALDLDSFDNGIYGGRRNIGYNSCNKIRYVDL